MVECVCPKIMTFDFQFQEVLEHTTFNFAEAGKEVILSTRGTRLKRDIELQIIHIMGNTMVLDELAEREHVYREQQRALNGPLSDPTVKNINGASGVDYYN